MSSPFSTFKQFSEAKGPIYTFANNPAIIGILLAIAFAILVYFLYASFFMKQENSKSKNPVVLSLLIVASVISSTAALINVHPTKLKTTAYHRSSQSEVATGWKKLQPLMLFGLMKVGVGATLRQKARRRSHRQSRRVKTYR